MGQASNYILVMLSINLIMGMIALSIQSIDPASDLLLSNKLFGTGTDRQLGTGGNANDNPVVYSVNRSGGVSTYNANLSQYDALGSSGSSIVSTADSAFPDWIRSGWTWATTVTRTYINFVGAPFTIVSMLGMDPELSALIGAFAGIFASFIILNWILGREN